MDSTTEIRLAALAKGRRLKRTNAVTALLSGALPGLVIAISTHISLPSWLAGLAIGLLWANAFEYVYHRFLLHWPRSSFGKGHLLHHRTVGTPEEAEHVTFGRSPVWVAALFTINGIPIVIADLIFSLGIAPGILTGFSLYLIVVEEIHWRIHLGGALPPGLSWTRVYHLAHHDIPTGRYNVFFPVFDVIFGNIRPPVAETEALALARAVPAHAGRLRGMALFEGALVWVWMMAIAIGIRYFWNSRIVLRG